MEIKHSTLRNKYENGGLFKVISLQCSWIKRLYDNSSHPWKIIPSYLTEKKVYTDAVASERV